MEHKKHDHDHGLAHDLPKILSRRSLIAGAGATMLAAPSLAQICMPSLTETAGPYPADGTNGTRGGGVLNVLVENGVMRQDIRPSFAGMNGTANGLQMDLELTLVDAQNNCAPIAGAVVYLWHCDEAGRYSLYDLSDQNYLRGVAQADENGKLTFTTIFPGCYRGRWPHMHFEVFRDMAHASSGQASLLTSQFALASDICQAVYSQDGRYGNSVQNFESQTPDRDFLFRGRSEAQIAHLTINTSVSNNIVQGIAEVGI